MSFQAILFDLDGTIVDTEPVAARVVREVFDGWGKKITVEESRFVVGKKFELALDMLYRAHQPPVAIEDALGMIQERYREVIRQEVTPVAGVVEAVRALAEEFPLAIVSGSSRAEIEIALDHLGIRDAFRYIVGAEDYPRSKPAPDGYLRACDLFGIEPSEALVFEDSSAGITSARDAGCTVVAVTCTNFTGADLSRADACIEDFRGVDAEWVRRLRRAP